MAPWRWHFALLGLAVAITVGVWISALSGLGPSRSSADWEGLLGAVDGMVRRLAVLAIVLGSALTLCCYGVVTSVLVWRLARRPRAVILIHSACAGAIVMVVAVASIMDTPRLLSQLGPAADRIKRGAQDEFKARSCVTASLWAEESFDDWEPGERVTRPVRLRLELDATRCHGVHRLSEVELSGSGRDWKLPARSLVVPPFPDKFPSRQSLSLGEIATAQKLHAKDFTVWFQFGGAEDRKLYPLDDVEISRTLE